MILQQNVRSNLALGLIAMMLVLAAQPILASSGSTGQEQPSRRGKNGPTNPPSPAANPNEQGPGNQDASPDDQTDPTTKANPGVSSRSNSPARPVQDPAPQKAKTETPPFDRPPLKAENNKPETDSHEPPASKSRSKQPSVQQSDRAGTEGPDDTDADPRPVRRSDDTGSGSGRGGRERPVLKRSPSTPPQTEEEPRSGSVPPPRQAPSSRKPDGDDTVKLSSTLVNIPLLVSDRNGRYVPQLSQRDFDLSEDGVKQEIAFFSSEEVPFSVALLMDVSPSVSGNLSDIQDAALEFVRQLRSQDRVMVVAFDKHVRYLTDFTSDRRELESAIRGTRTGSGTSVYEAVYDTVTRKMIGLEGRKALILLSDGEDTTSSSASYDDAVNVVSESEVLVYGLRYPGSNGVAGRGGNVPWPFPRTRNPLPIPIPLPLPWPWPRRRGPFTFNSPLSPRALAALPRDPLPQRRGRRAGDFMADVAAAGGGPVYDAHGIHDLSRLARQIAEELRHVYVVSYYPTNALSNGGYRSIRVHVTNRPDIVVRCRRGYNAHDVEKGH